MSKLISLKNYNCPICEKEHPVEKRKRKAYVEIKNELVEYEEFYYNCNNVEGEYVIQTGSTEAINSGTSKWANAQTEDGSYWVWIPRYAYKINSNWGYYDVSSPQGEIDVVFIDTNNKNGNTTYSKTYPGVTNPGTAIGAMEDFVVHPAFTWGTGETARELPGIWVAKFEASMSDAGITKDSIGSSNVIKIQPGKTSWRSISNNDAFINCKNMNNVSNPYGFDVSNTPHMMKNTEWGAVAYLSQSKYGRNRTAVIINNSSDYITGSAGNSVNALTDIETTEWTTSTGMLASTTGNIYGIYDMSGGAWEKTVGYIDFINVQDETSRINNASLLELENALYVEVYPETYDTIDPREETGKFGDAIYETSSWNADYNGYPHVNGPILLRGGGFRNKSSAGIFCFGANLSGTDAGSSFRPVCFGDTTL